MKRKVLITGGAGYIGSHVVKRFREESYDLLVLDNFSNGHVDSLLGNPYVRADLRDINSIDKVFGSFNPDVLVHLASSIEVGESVKNPIEYYENNVVGSLNLIKIASRYNVKHVIFSSTAAVYGAPSTDFIREESVLHPTNPYGNTKLIVERVLRDVAHIAGFSFVSLRYFNAAGADGSGLIGERHDPETHLIPLLLGALGEGGNSFTVYGTDYSETIDGTCVRDFVHVEDLASGHLAALRYLERGGESMEVNLGSGVGFSVREVINTAVQLTGREVTLLDGGRRRGDPPSLVADVSKARIDLGWMPEKSSLEQIVKDAWAWHLKLKGMS